MYCKWDIFHSKGETINIITLHGSSGSVKEFEAIEVAQFKVILRTVFYDQPWNLIRYKRLMKEKCKDRAIHRVSILLNWFQLTQFPTFLRITNCPRFSFNSHSRAPRK